MVDIIVIGGGAAGMTAALYARRNGKSVLVLEGESLGGQIATSPRLENFPSIKEISGEAFADNLFEQIVDLGAEVEIEKAVSIEKRADKSFLVRTEYNEYAAKVAKYFDTVGVRATIDDRNEKIGRKIRDNEMKRIPYMLVVGEKEQADGSVAVRKQGHGDQGSMSMEDFAKKVNDEVAEQLKAIEK